MSSGSRFCDPQLTSAWQLLSIASCPTMRTYLSKDSRKHPTVAPSSSEPSRRQPSTTRRRSGRNFGSDTDSSVFCATMKPRCLPVARCIFENPVRGGLVERVEDYPFLGSSLYTTAQVLEAVQLRDGPLEGGHYVRGGST